MSLLNLFLAVDVMATESPRKRSFKKNRLIKVDAVPVVFYPRHRRSTPLLSSMGSDDSDSKNVDIEDRNVRNGEADFDDSFISVRKVILQRDSISEDGASESCLESDKDAEVCDTNERDKGIDHRCIIDTKNLVNNERLFHRSPMEDCYDDLSSSGESYSRKKFLCINKRYMIICCSHTIVFVVGLAGGGGVVYYYYHYYLNSSDNQNHTNGTNSTKVDLFIH